MVCAVNLNHAVWEMDMLYYSLNIPFDILCILF